MRDCFVFDLDGTLLNTLPDLVDSTNSVLRELGYPMRSEQEIVSFIGNGARQLIFRAVPCGTPTEDAEAALAVWKERYPSQGYPKTRPYDGIDDTLAQLKHQKVKLGVLSNKFDGAAKENIGQFLPGRFDAVYGERAGMPRKPDPTALLALIEELGCAPERCAYVGDSPVDIEVALNAGTMAVGVSWGYNSVSSLLSAGADVIVGHPSELAELM